MRSGRRWCLRFASSATPPDSVPYLVAIRGPNVERVRGLLAVKGIQSVVGQTPDAAVTARLSAEGAEQAEARVCAAVGEPYTLAPAELEEGSEGQT